MRKDSLYVSRNDFFRTRKLVPVQFSAIHPYSVYAVKGEKGFSKSVYIYCLNGVISIVFAQKGEGYPIFGKNFRKYYMDGP